jgi:hypothetical protein
LLAEIVSYPLQIFFRLNFFFWFVWLKIIFYRLVLLLIILHFFCSKFISFGSTTGQKPWRRKSNIFWSEIKVSFSFFLVFQKKRNLMYIWNKVCALSLKWRGKKKKNFFLERILNFYWVRISLKYNIERTNPQKKYIKRLFYFSFFICVCVCLLFFVSINK